MERFCAALGKAVVELRACRLPCRVLLLLLAVFVMQGNTEEVVSDDNLGAIAFAVVGRTQYAFDIFLCQVPPLADTSSSTDSSAHLTRTGDRLQDQHAQELLQLTPPPIEFRHTEGPSVNFNGQFVAKGGEAVTSASSADTQKEGPTADLLFVSERSMNMAQVFHVKAGSPAVKLTHDLALHDRPSLVPTSNHLIYASTQEPSGKSRQGWTAVYSTDLRTNETQRLTPAGVTDYSPAVSPSGEWVAVASMEGREWERELKFLPTDIYIFRSSDGSHRRRVAVDGGWPAWSPDGKTIYFHRVDAEGWFSIYKVEGLDVEEAGVKPLEALRVTPAGLHAMTPAAAPSGRFLAVATRRPESPFRQIEIFDLEKRNFLPVTSLINPKANHYNPFISPDSRWVGYHRCGPSGSTSVVDRPDVTLEDSEEEVITGSSSGVPNIEPLLSPLKRLALLRVSGDFPVFSPDGTKIAMIPSVGSEDSGVVLMNLDGSDQHFVYRGAAFGLSWNPAKPDTLYTATGPIFATEGAEVHIIAIEGIDEKSDEGPSWRHLTKAGTGNNAFPAVSPDGKKIVFRSGRSGSKNLYIMDAEKGEDGYIQPLTDGPWTDTMANWSPDGEWIAFSSDRNMEGTFEIFLIHPNGTGLHKLFATGPNGRSNHPYFRGDSKKIVFTSDYAGISAEPVSVPHQFQPYGDIFVINIDGSGLVRLTHNAYEDGTPAWGSAYIDPRKVSAEGGDLTCSFRDNTFLTPPTSGTGRIQSSLTPSC